MPTGELLTVPVPVTVTVKVGGLRMKVAVTELALLKVTTHDPLPLHAPPHPPNVEPVFGVSFRVTCVPSLKLALQVVPQLMPAGELVTTPDPVPAKLTVRVPGAVLNVAVTDAFALSVTVQVLVPLQAPVHPVKTDPALAAAVRLIGLFVLKLPEQVDPQLMPDGALVTVPSPLPAFCTLSFAVLGGFGWLGGVESPLQPARKISRAAVDTLRSVGLSMDIRRALLPLRRHGQKRNLDGKSHACVVRIPRPTGHARHLDVLFIGKTWTYKAEKSEAVYLKKLSRRKMVSIP